MHCVHQVEVNEVSPSQIRAEAEKLARNEVASQLAQFQEFGIMANWSPETTYRTLGECKPPSMLKSTLHDVYSP